MVQAIKGHLVDCDVPTKQFLVSLNDGLPTAEQFIVCELDDTRLFIKQSRADFVRAKLKTWAESHSYQAPQSKGAAGN